MDELDNLKERYLKKGLRALELELGYLDADDLGSLVRTPEICKMEDAIASKDVLKTADYIDFELARKIPDGKNNHRSLKLREHFFNLVTMYTRMNEDVRWPHGETFAQYRTRAPEAYDRTIARLDESIRRFGITFI